MITMHTVNLDKPKDLQIQTPKKNRVWLLIVLKLLLLLLAFNFLSFQLASSRTESGFTLSTYRLGETAPATMSSGFSLVYTVTGSDPMSQAVADALADALAATEVGQATAVANLDGVTGPALLVTLDKQERLWTPVYGRANLTAVVYYAYDGQAPWPLDEAVHLTESPAVKADGEFTISDTTWGLLSRPGYQDHLAAALAQAIAGGLQQDVFQP